MLIIEEAESIDVDMLNLFLGHKYILQHTTLCPSKYGALCRRPRFWAAAFHRSYISQVYSSLDNVARVFERVGLAPWWTVFDWGEEQEQVKSELDRSLQWSAGRSSSMAHGKSLRDIKDHEDESQVFVCTLTPKEQTWVAEYGRLNGDGVHLLSQDPFTTHRISSGFNQYGTAVFYTLLHNGAIHWSSIHSRWASGSELLAVMGFPTTPELANPRSGVRRRLCSFCARSPSAADGLDPSERTLRHMAAQAGNSQHVSLNVLLKLFCLMFSLPADQTPFARIFGSRAGKY
jgi:hypothetical protein